MGTINSLSEFIERLGEIEANSFPKIIKSLEIPKSEFEKYATWKKDRYTRNSIVRTEAFELILLCWNIKQETPIHEHGGQKCWVYQIDGEVEEKRYQSDESKELKVTSRMKLTAGTITYMDNSMGYHTLTNLDNKRAMTLHIYVKPIDSCEIFCDKAEAFITKELEYDTFKK